MDNRHPKRINSVSNSDALSHADRISSLKIILKLRMVYFSILKELKRLTIPFAATSSALLFSTFEKAKADTLWQRGRNAVENSPFNVEEGNSRLDHLKRAKDNWDMIGDTIAKVLDWINHLPENITEMSYDLLAWIYKFTSDVVLHTPLWLFKNTWFKDTSLVFSSISVLIVIILTMIESIKQMLNAQGTVLNVSYTKFSTIMKRLPLALIGAGFAPILFEKSFELLNKLSHAITKIGYSEMIAKGEVRQFLPAEVGNTILLLGFDAALITLLFPIILSSGRRWFDLLCLGVLTPLSLTAWIFDRYKHLHSKWWNNVKTLSLIQLVYALFVCVLGLFIFGTRGATGIDSTIFRLLIVIGGLFRLSNPPSFITNGSSNGKGLLTMAREVRDTVTMRKFAPAVYIRSKMPKVKTPKEKLVEERLKQGKRFVK